MVKGLRLCSTPLVTLTTEIALQVTSLQSTIHIHTHANDQVFSESPAIRREHSHTEAELLVMIFIHVEIK